ncbi:MAG: TlpA family protein disulfide reductase [Treponema sp.]|nr:TlpA family protein disulfide reductase [Treponema sp.]
MKNIKHFLIIVTLVLATSSLFAQNIREGAVAPDFTLTLSSGEQLKLSDCKGKAVLLHFWATWCPPCRIELPEMNKLAEKLDANAKLQFLAVCISDTEKNRASFMQKNKYTFPGGLDSDNSIAFKYGVQGIPMSLLIAPDGKIEKIHVGMMNKTQLADFIKKYASL